MSGTIEVFTGQSHQRIRIHVLNLTATFGEFLRTLGLRMTMLEILMRRMRGPKDWIKRGESILNAVLNVLTYVFLWWRRELVGVIGEP